MHEMLHRDVAINLAPKLTEAVIYNLMNSPDNNLRNFSTQRIQESLLNLGLIAKRFYSLKEKTEMIDKLDMDLSIKCFKSDFLERKI
jgi:ubiquitin carboxyl-terminal hydrolase 34